MQQDFGFFLSPGGTSPATRGRSVVDTRSKKVKVKVAQSCPTLCDPMDYTVRGILQARILEWQLFPSPGNLPNPVIEPRSPSLQADSLPAEPQGRPKNTRVGSLSILQWIFLTQESNWGLLHCKQTLYQLSYQGSRSKKGCRKANICSVQCYGDLALVSPHGVPG